MTSSFAALKKSRTSEFQKLNEQLQKMNTNASSGDDRYWKLEVDKAGNGYAIIRFLPAPTGEDLPFCRLWDHGFQGPGGWYIENSLTTLQKDDPVSEYNSKLWNSGIESNKEIARKQKRRLNYHANIYVVKDPANPANEGKVFLYKFGTKIWDKLNDAMNPQYQDETPFNPFDFWAGADFKLKARQVEGWRNYDKSEFDTPAPIKKPDGSEMTEDEMETLWNSQHSLTALIDPKNFKSYDELKKKLYKVLGLDGDTASEMSSDREEEMSYKPTFKEKEATESRSVAADSDDEDDEDDMSFFSRLAKED